MNLEVIKLRWDIFWFGVGFRRTLKVVAKLPPHQQRPILTKWKWDASRVREVKMREALLDAIAKYEQLLRIPPKG